MKLKRKIKDIKNTVFARIHRSKNGWAPEDTWNLDIYFAKVIRDSVTYLSENIHGYPTDDDMTKDEWVKVLRQIIEGMDAAVIISDMSWGTKENFKALNEKHEIAMTLLSKWWFNLWD